MEGLKIALDNLDAVINTIRSSANADIAKTALVEKFTLSLRQAQAILDMRLQRLTGLERKKSTMNISTLWKRLIGWRAFWQMSKKSSILLKKICWK